MIATHIYKKALFSLQFLENKVEENIFRKLRKGDPGKDSERAGDAKKQAVIQWKYRPLQENISVIMIDSAGHYPQDRYSL
jgi:hypothetical protein